MQELRPGLWTWTAPHPDWTPADAGPHGWERDVRCAAVATDDELVLIDPLSPPAAVLALADGRRVSVVLTCAWHQRSARELRKEHGAGVYSPASGVEHLEFPANGYELGDGLPGGVVAAAGYYAGEVVLWVPEQRTLFAGDAFVAPPLRFQRAWLPDGIGLTDALERLQPLRELPVEVVLVGHGDAVTDGARAALAAALEA